MVTLVPVLALADGVFMLTEGDVQSTITFATGIDVSYPALSDTFADMIAVPSVPRRLLMSAVHFLRVKSPSGFSLPGTSSNSDA